MQYNVVFALKNIGFNTILKPLKILSYNKLLVSNIKFLWKWSLIVFAFYSE